MRTGLYISGIGHGLLFLWLVIGGLISWSRDDVPLRVSEVSMISEDEFAALTAPKPQADAPDEAPAPDPVPAAPEATPVPPARPEPEPVPEPTPAPEPAPEPEPTPDPTPEPPAPEPAPQDVPRVAPEPAPEPEPQVEVAPEVVETPTPSPEATTPAPDEVIPTAPEAATTEIVTEATETAAPTKSVRPATRPNRPTPPVVAEPDTPDAPVAPTPPANAAANAVANAVNDAVAGGTQDVPDQDIPEGPPMSRGEKEGLRLAVKQCWNLGSTSSDALRTTVVVLVDMDRNGKPTNVALQSWDGPSQGAANTAFQAARRAVLICGRSGYDLPAEKYGQWRQIEMTFNPDKMRIK